MSKQAEHASIWQVFRYPTFVSMWLGMVLFNLGIWLNEIAAGWLMTSMTTDTRFIAMLQFCLNIPIFLFALPAGYLGDRVNRRRLLLAMQTVLLGGLGILAFLVLNGWITPVSLLIFTFLTGSAVALTSPIRQAAWTMIVPKTQLRSALALAAIGFNGSRAIGPTLGGLAIALVGAGVTYLFHAAMLLVVTAIVFFWRCEEPSVSLRESTMVSEIRAAFFYLKNDELLKNCMIRQLCYMGVASALWVLLPVIARSLSGNDPIVYSICVASVGMGSVLGGIPVPYLQHRFGSETLLTIGTGLSALSLLILSSTGQIVPSVMAGFAFGVGWIFVSAAIGLAIQLSVLEEYRARILSISLVLFAAAGISGAIVWGTLASIFSLSQTLSIAAVAMVIISLFGRAFFTVSSDFPTASEHTLSDCRTQPRTRDD